MMSVSATLGADPARMRPLYFGGRFGWLHAAASTGHTGVVMPGALAQEEVCTRYGLMTLADLLATAGFPTLRFDYRGTGDSDDSELSTASMREDIVQAAECLRQQAQVDTVVLCGLRAGATLALAVAPDIAGLAGIALLAPIVSGAAYLRDLSVSVRFSPLALLDPVPPSGSTAPLNTNGFAWSAGLRDDIRTLDLAALPAPRVPTFVAAPHASARTDGIVAAWRASGTTVTETCFADYPGFMRDPTTHVLPEGTFAATVDWVRSLAPAPSAQPVPAAPVDDRLDLETSVETPLRLGPDGATFGILCRPANSQGSGVAALLLHEGSSHRIGNGRAGVQLARQLAAAGHASLRIDLSGMGDSPCAPGRRRPFSDPERLGEALDAVEALAPHAPGGIVVSGLCSGAEMAFHTALADPRVAAAILANIPAIGWEQLEVGAPPPPSRRTIRSSWRAIRAGGWRRVVRGEVRMMEAARGLRLRVRRVRAAAHTLVRAQMRQLADRGTGILFVFSDDDPGLVEVRAQLGNVADFASARIHVLDRADHHFNAFDTRARYEALYMSTVQDLADRHRARAATLGGAAEAAR